MVFHRWWTDSQKNITYIFISSLHYSSIMRLTYTEETEMDKTILIVEDEPILREVLKDFFLNESYQVFEAEEDRKSTRLNSSHVAISYAVFCLKKKKKKQK